MFLRTVLALPAHTHKLSSIARVLHTWYPSVRAGARVHSARASARRGAARPHTLARALKGTPRVRQVVFSGCEHACIGWPRGAVQPSLDISCAFRTGTIKCKRCGGLRGILSACVRSHGSKAVCAFYHLCACVIFAVQPPRQLAHLCVAPMCRVTSARSSHGLGARAAHMSLELAGISSFIEPSSSGWYLTIISASSL